MSDQPEQTPDADDQDMFAYLTPEEKQNYANFWTSVFMSTCGPDPIPLELDDDRAEFCHRCGYELEHGECANPYCTENPRFTEDGDNGPE